MVVIAGISGSVILWNHNKSGVPIMGSQAVKEASAEKGSISKTIVGTGNLEADTPVNVTVPSGVVIDEVKVESGDHVSAGDVLATVDNASVLSAMRDVQEKIENLDGVINETKDETEAGELTASVDGRVKRIYVSQGSSIADSMLENGAVMLLSIDGKMAVKLELTGAAAEGDNVTVLLLDGSEKTGTIESIDGSTCVITFSDSDVGIGENVSVTDAEGTILGSGEAYIHQQLAVTATGGTVEEIKVSEDESVSADTTLLTLTETTQSVKYLEALAEREAYAETLQKLIERFRKRFCQGGDGWYHSECQCISRQFREQSEQQCLSNICIRKFIRQGEQYVISGIRYEGLFLRGDHPGRYRGKKLEESSFLDREQYGSGNTFGCGGTGNKNTVGGSW